MWNFQKYREITNLVRGYSKLGETSQIRNTNEP